MFGATNQKLKEQTIHITESKKEQTTDKIELKKKHAAQMVDFRTIFLKSKIQPIATTVFPVAFPTPAFTFTIERKTIFQKQFTYHEIPKKINHGNSKFERNFKWILPIYRNGTDFFTFLIN